MLASKPKGERSMRRLPRLGLLLLPLLLSGCSILGIGIKEPALSKPNALCPHLTIVRPSRSKDKIGDEETARGIASNNAVIQSACVGPPRFASAQVRA